MEGDKCCRKKSEQNKEVEQLMSLSRALCQWLARGGRWPWSVCRALHMPGACKHLLHSCKDEGASPRMGRSLLEQIQELPAANAETCP